MGKGSSEEVTSDGFLSGWRALPAGRTVWSLSTRTSQKGKQSRHGLAFGVLLLKENDYGCETKIDWEWMCNCNRNPRTFFPPSFLYIITSLTSQQINHSDFGTDIFNFSASLGYQLHNLNYPELPPAEYLLEVVGVKFYLLLHLSTFLDSIHSTAETWTEIFGVEERKI